MMMMAMMKLLMTKIVITMMLLVGQGHTIAKEKAGSKMLEMEVMKEKKPAAAMEAREPGEAMEDMQPVVAMLLLETMKDIKPI